MSTEQRSRLIRRRKLVVYSGRGEIYAWLRAHHKQIVALRVGEDRPWAEVIAEMRMDLSLAGSEAPSLTPQNVCNVWSRVCRDVGDKPARVARTYPSRAPKGWKPHVVRHEPPPPGHEYVLTPGIHPPGTDLIRKTSSDAVPAAGTRDVKAELEALRRLLRSRS